MDFSALGKKSSQSFHQQKALIKKVLAGQQMPCPVCKQSLRVFPPGSDQPGIRCPKGCTDIALDFS